MSWRAIEDRRGSGWSITLMIPCLLWLGMPMGGTRYSRRAAASAELYPGSWFSLSIPKLVLAPQKSVKFLGYIVDLGANRLTVDPNRVSKLKAILGRLLASLRGVHVKDLARVTGMLQSMHLAVGQSVAHFH